MTVERTRHRRWLAALIFGALVATTASVAAADDPENLLAKADQYEKEGRWKNACTLYDQILSQDRHTTGIKEHFLICLRHVLFERRHHDPTFRDQIQTQDLSVALKIYNEVLTRVAANYVDKEKASFTQLFHNGVSEYQLALNDPAFRRDHLSANSSGAIQTFLGQLDKQWGTAEVHDKAEAQALVVEISLAAQKSLRLKPAVTVLEFACGACNGLDEYSFYLTPGQLGDVVASLEGVTAGIGIEVTLLDHKVIISQITPDSPAAVAGLKFGDQILRIDTKGTAHFSSERVAEELKGPPGTRVEIQALSPGEKKPRALSIFRQTLDLPSVVQVQMINPQEGIGYFRLASFQKSTVQEVDEALLELKMQGIKGLILDMRGNPGGMFRPAIQTAERFLADGVIVSLQSQLHDLPRTFKANNPNALLIPLVVLIDAGTASAGEILAGALKDNQRALLIGQPTFGKGTIQGVFQLETVSSGIRVTLARFYSPKGQAYSGQGVSPHLLIESSPMTITDAPLQAALQEISRLILSRQ